MSTAREGSLRMVCPDCKQSMIILEYKDIEVDFCARCKGCWLDEGELEQMLPSREAAMGLVDWSSGRTGERRCPRCTDKLHVLTLPGGGPEIDVCPAACGIWFDKGELRAVVRARLPESAAAQVVQTLTEMFGTLEESKEE